MVETPPPIRVADVMSRDIEMIDGQNTVRDALLMMQVGRKSSLLVFKSEPHDEFGLLLLSDIADQVLARDRAPQRVSVYEVMAKPALWVEAQMSINDCARLLTQAGIHAAPVLEGERLVGVVSLYDLVLKGAMRQPPEGQAST